MSFTIRSYQIPVIVDKCKAAERGLTPCDYAYNAYLCFYSETQNKPELIDNSQSTFDTVLNEKFKLLFGFGLEEGDHELFDDEGRTEETEKISAKQ